MDYSYEQLLAGDVDQRSLLERGRRMGHDLSAPHALIAVNAGEDELEIAVTTLGGVVPPPLD